MAIRFDSKPIVATGIVGAAVGVLVGVILDNVKKTTV